MEANPTGLAARPIRVASWRNSFFLLLCTAVVAVGSGSWAAGSALGATTASGSTWSQNGADAAQSNRNTGETVLTSQTLPSLTRAYTLTQVAPFGVCGGMGFHDDVPVSDGISLFYFDGARMVSVALSSGVRRWRAAQVVPNSFGLVRVNSIAVVGASVFVAGTADCSSVSDPGGYVTAYKAQTGARLWTLKLPFVVISMAVAGNHVVVSGTNAGGATTASVSDITGAMQWSTAFPRECSATSSIFVVGNVIPVVCVDQMSNLTYTAGLSLTSGAELWRKAGGFLYWRGDGPSATTAHAIYATDTSGHLLSMRQDGTSVWRSTTETGRVLAAGPSRIYVSCDTSSLCGLNRLTGARLWKASGVNATRVALAADVVYPSPGSPLDAATGAPIAVAGYSSQGTSAAVAAGHVWTTTGSSLDVYAPGN